MPHGSPGPLAIGTGKGRVLAKHYREEREGAGAVQKPRRIQIEFGFTGRLKERRNRR